MIKLVKRKKLDIAKYNECIERSAQANVYGYSWYLDTICKKWSVFVLNDYEAVMPIPWRRKFFIKYVYPPFWLLQLGLFTKEIEDENEFLIELFGEFKYVDLRTNFENAFSMFQKYQQSRQTQYLNLSTSYNVTASKYKRDRKKDLQRAQKNKLTFKWNGNPEELIALYRNNIGKRVKKIKDKDYEVLLNLMTLCREKGAGDLLTVNDEQGKLVGAGFFLTYKERVSILVSATDLKNRKNGANTFLIDQAIQNYYKNYAIFDFGGSIMPTVANFFNSFGASDQEYVNLKCNRLPWLMRIFKR